jgi:tetratricopeptide (TPR) repeat protein
MRGFTLAPIRFPLTLVLVLLLFSATASAQSEEDIEQAGALYEEGIDAFQEGDFARAIELFEQAYGFDPHPMFLYNISVAHSRQGKGEEAYATAGRIYGDELLPPDTLVRNAGRYHAMSARLTAIALSEAIVEAGREPVASKSEPPGPGFFESIPLSWIGWTGAGTAATGLTLMVVAGVISSSLTPELDAYEEARLAADRARMDSLRSDIERTQSTGKFVLYAGTGLALVGSGLLVYDLVIRERADTPGSTARLSGSVGPGTASVGVSLSF